MLKSISYYFLFANILLFISSCTQVENKDLVSNGILTGMITDEAISEASGMAISRINPDTIWLHNDGENPTSIYAVNSLGNRVVTISITGAENIDWEDMAIVEYDGQQYLLIADIGDNSSNRETYRLHFILEPDLAKQSILMDTELSVSPSWTIEFQYEDGPRDSESIAVDTSSETIFLLSKRDQPPVLYSLPLHGNKTSSTESNKPLVAKRTGTIKPLPELATRRFRLLDLIGYTQFPTSMDISSDGQSAVILTYGDAYYFSKNKSDDWLTTFQKAPKELKLPNLDQAESIAFDPSGMSVFITSEELPAPLYKLELDNLK